jgi:hypothetical protein
MLPSGAPFPGAWACMTCAKIMVTAITATQSARNPNSSRAQEKRLAFGFSTPGSGGFWLLILLGISFALRWNALERVTDQCQLVHNFQAGSTEARHQM